MIEDKKHSAAPSTEKEFVHFNALTSVLKESILSYSTPSDLGRTSCVSKEIKDLSSKEAFWKSFLYKTNEDKLKKKSSAKDIYQNEPEKRLPNINLLIPLHYRSANVCRIILKNNPKDFEALSRLAFLIGIGQASHPEDSKDLTNPSALLLGIWQNNHVIESLYYLARLRILNAATEPQGVLNLLEVLTNHRNHIGAICAVANLTGNGKMRADQTDFLFADVTSPPPGTTGYSHLLKNRAYLLYETAMQLGPVYAEGVLCGLANLEKQSEFVINLERLQYYAGLIGKSEIVPMSGSSLNIQAASMLYRKILEKHPNHVGAVFGLTELIGNKLVTAQFDDFLIKEKNNRQIPQDLIDKEITLFERIKTQSLDAKTHYDTLVLHRRVNVILSEIPLDFWPDHLKPHVQDFKNLTRKQRQSIWNAMLVAQREYYSDNGRHRALIHQLDREKFYVLLRLTGVFILLSVGPMGLLYVKAADVPFEYVGGELVKRHDLDFRIGGAVALHLLLLMSIVYSGYLLMTKKDKDEKQAVTTDLHKAFVDKIQTDDAIMQSLFPKLKRQEEKEIFLRLWNIPQTNWDSKITIINNFYHSTSENKQLVINQVQAVDQVDIANYTKIKMAQAKEWMIKFSPFLFITCAGCYGMYQTYSVLNLPDGGGIGFYLSAEAASLILFTGMIYLLMQKFDLNFEDHAKKAVRDNLIVGEITAPG